MFYYNSAPRRYLHFQVNGVSYREDIRRFENIRRHEETPRCVETGLVETCNISGTADDWLEETQRGEQSTSLCSEVTESNDSRSQRIPESSKTTARRIKAKILDQGVIIYHLERLCVTPIASTCTIQEWINDSELSIYDKQDKDYIKAVTLLERRLAFKTFHEMMYKYSLISFSGIWYSRVPNYYFTPAKSYAIMYALIMFQCDFDHDFAGNCIEEMYNILERKVPKKNTIYISGQANSGKTYFFDSILAFYANVGHVANFVRGDHFPLNDCVNRRVLLWNEPSIMPSAYDTVKMLVGGDSCPVNVKYEKHTVIPKTPLIITSNNTSLFPNDPTWNSRLFQMTWRACKNLRKYKKYLHPMAYPLLLHKFNVIDLNLYSFVEDLNILYAFDLSQSMN